MRVFLNGRHMHTARGVLRKRFPGLDGLQSTLLSQTSNFDTVCNEGKIDVIYNFCSINASIIKA